MKFDLWTFSFQLINFVVLLLILKRILYKPVREIMEKRRAQAAKMMEDAEATRKEAEELKVRNQAELKRFQKQRGQMMEEMKTDIAQQRQQLLDEAEQEVQRRIDKQEALIAAEKQRRHADFKNQTMETSVLFAENIFRGIADEDLHRALYRRLLGKLPEIATDLVHATNPGADLKIEVVSAYPLREDDAQALQTALATGTNRPVILNGMIDKGLIAGIRIRAGDKIYDASLRDQLSSFKVKLKEDVSDG